MLFELPIQTLDPGPSTPKRGTKTNDVALPIWDEIDSDVVEEYNSSKDGAGTRRAEWEHRQSVSAAYWDPRGRSIVSTSYDNNLRRKFLHCGFYCNPVLGPIDMVSRFSMGHTTRSVRQRKSPFIQTVVPY